jgi:hypothetical protein
MEKYQTKAAELTEAAILPAASISHHTAYNILFKHGPHIEPQQIANPVKKEWSLYPASGIELDMNMLTYWQVCAVIF